MAEPLYGVEAANLLSGKQLCTACLAAVDVAGTWGSRPATNAIAIDPDDVVHQADAIAGTTACGINANLWQWVVPTVEGRKVDEVEQ